MIQQSDALDERGLRIDAASRQRFIAQGWWRERGTFLDDFQASSAAYPDKVAVVAHRATGAVTRISYAELRQRARQVAGGLLELGVNPGDVVSAQLPNWWEFVAIALGTNMIGAVINPIIPIHRQREVEFIATLTESRVLFVPDEFRGFSNAKMAAEVQRAVSSLEHVVVVGPNSRAGISFEHFFLRNRWDTHHAKRLEKTSARPDDVAELQFTSGTTGEPKGVAHTFNTQYARARAMYEPLGLTAADTVLMASTLAHSSGFLYGYMVPLTLGMTSVLQDVWDPHVMLALVEQERVTWSMGATTFVVDSIRAQREVPRDTGSLRYFVSGGAAIPPQTINEASEVLGTRLMAVWGLTENGNITITRPDQPLDAAAQSDGRPVAWMEVAIRDADGHPVHHGETGRLWVRGASQTVGYYKRRETYEKSLDAAGWFDTGDLGREHGDGEIRIVGRAKDLVNRGGENVPVVEVEATLSTHPAVKEVAIVAYPDDRLGERACAVVVLHEGHPFQLRDICEHLEAAHMSKSYWPERLEVVADLPTTLSGKVQKYKLREMLKLADTERLSGQMDDSV